MIFNYVLDLKNDITTLLRSRNKDINLLKQNKYTIIIMINWYIK